VSSSGPRPTRFGTALISTLTARQRDEPEGRRTKAKPETSLAGSHGPTQKPITGAQARYMSFHSRPCGDLAMSVFSFVFRVPGTSLRAARRRPVR
jgi:hypothetical protein